MTFDYRLIPRTASSIIELVEGKRLMFGNKSIYVYIERTLRMRPVIFCDHYIVNILRLERNIKTKKEIHRQFSWNAGLQKTFLALNVK